MHTFTKFKTIGTYLVLLTLIACGSELPIQEMNNAKREIGRADSLRASEFAPDELSEAKKSLFLAHDKASEENGNEAKKLSDYAISKAYDALEKTLPKLSNQTREEATLAIDLADEAFATGLSPNEFDKAVSLRKEGDIRMERGDQALGEFLQERDETKKLTLRQSAFNEYEASYNNYLESKKSAEAARTTSLNSRSELRQSARFVEEDLNTADTFLGGPNEKTQNERVSLASAYQDIDRGELKKANEKIQSSRSKARALLANSIQNYARERLQTATEVVEDSNARFEKINESDIQTNTERRMSYESANENLKAANEALSSAGNLYSQEKYEDSIKQSEEAIRLSAIVLDQSTQFSSEALAQKRALDEKNSKSTNATVSEKPKKSSSKTLKEGWSRYKVRKTRPEDCLWRIAERKEYYGNAKLWPRIYQANKSQIQNKHLIYPNQVLYIPPKKGSTEVPYKNEEANENSNRNNPKLNLQSEGNKRANDSNPSRPNNPNRSVNGPDDPEFESNSIADEDLIDGENSNDGEFSEDKKQ